MALSPLKKLILPPVFLSVAVFSALTLPLSFLGSEPVVVQIQEEPVFYGKVRDMATPYLALASVLSLGAGVATFAVTGWLQSSRQSAQLKEQLSSLQQHLQDKEKLLEELRLSESRLEAFGLSAFLDEKVSEDQTVTACTAMKVAQPAIVETPVQVVEPLVITAQPAEVRLVEPTHNTAQAEKAMFSSAQTSPLGRKPTVVGSEVSETPTAPALLPVENLQNQLKQLMAQMETFQNALQTTPQRVMLEATVSDTLVKSGVAAAKEQ